MSLLLILGEEFMNFITSLLMKWFGPSFLEKHRTTVFLFMIGLFDKIPLPIPQEIKTELSTGMAGLILWIGAYLIAGKIDSKPATPDLVQK